MANNIKETNNGQKNQSDAENTAACSVNVNIGGNADKSTRLIEVKNSMPPPPNPNRNEDNNEP